VLEKQHAHGKQLPNPPEGFQAAHARSTEDTICRWPLHVACSPFVQVVQLKITETEPEGLSTNATLPLHALGELVFGAQLQEMEEELSGAFGQTCCQAAP
jgi:hypothetical protein